MATGNKVAWQHIQSKLAAMGYVRQTVIGDPRGGAQSGMVAIVPLGGEVDETTCKHPREVHRILLRMYRNHLEEPQGETEFLLDQFRADIEEDVMGDFELGGNVAYALPAQFEWSYDTATVENILYRTVEVTVAYRVDDRAAFAP